MAAPPNYRPRLTLLLTLRMDRGFSIAEVERRTGVSHKTIKDYECGRKMSPHAGVLHKLATLYDVPPSVLLKDMREQYEYREERAERAAQAAVEEILDAA